MLLPVDIAVDSNRDGVIKFAGNSNNQSVADKPIDIASQDKPYRFWINDDSDQDLIDTGGGKYTYLESEAVPALYPDFKNDKIVNKRDLEDYARLWFFIGGMQDAIATGNIQVGLKWKTVSSNSPAIKIFASADPDGADDYLKDVDAATAQCTSPYCNAIKDKNGKTMVDTNATFILPVSFWDGLSASNPNKFLLFEGASEGKGQLEFVFLDKSGNQIGEGGSVWLDLMNVKRMYGRAKVTGMDDNFQPPSQTVPSQPPEPQMGYAYDSNYPFDTSCASWVETKQYIVFVHGWNMTYDESINFAETMFKRLWHHGYTGRFLSFRWPTKTGVASYNDSEYRGWKCGESLKQLVSGLPSNYTRDLVSHSMGGIVCGSALHKGMSVANYSLLNAAVPAICYDDRVDGNGKSVLDENWGYSTPCYDSDQNIRNLSYRYKLNQVSANLISYFLPNDSALKAWELNNYTSGPFSLGAKPQRYNLGVTGYSYGIVGNPDANVKSIWLTVPGDVRYVTTAHEAMAYAVQSPTKTVGANGATQGPISSSVNMGSNYNFGSTHSAEFNFSIQATTQFYGELLDGMGIPRAQ